LFFEILDGGLSDFPIWDIQYPFEGNIIYRIEKVSDIRNNVLDFFSFEEFERSIYFVRNPFLDKELFKRGGLSVCPI